MKDNLKLIFCVLLIIAVVAAGAYFINGSNNQKLAGGTTNLTALALDETLSVTGATSLSSTLGVAGATSLSSTLAVTGNTTVGGTLGVTGATTLASTMSAGDKATFSGETVFASSAITPTTGSTLTVASTFYVVNSSGAISMTLGTTGATAGQMLILYGDDNNTVTINDTNIRTTTGSALSLGQYDLAVFIFNGTDWIEWLLAANS